MGKHKKEKKHKEKKSKKSKHKKKHYSSSESSSTSEDEWIEKEVRQTEEQKPKENVSQRDDWMSLTSLPGLFSNKERKQENENTKRDEKEKAKYDPKTSVRELNPYWKDGGDGLPSAVKTNFMKPIYDDYSTSKYEQGKYSSKSSHSNWRTKSSKNDEDFRTSKYNDRDRYSSKSLKSNWRKKSPKREKSPRIEERATSSKTSEITYECDEEFTSPRYERSSPKSESSNSKANQDTSDYLTDKEMNDLAAKIVKAEILGNSERVTELKQKLERARNYRNTNQKPEENEEVLLTQTDSKGFAKPLTSRETDPYNSKRKKQTINTHDAGKRQKYYPDDGKYSLHNMFENEKFGNTDKQEEEFMQAASKLAKMDDLEDMFMDNIRKKESDEKSNRKDRDRAIREHQKITQSLDNCIHCVQSTNMLKHLMVSLGETIYLTLPQYEPLTDGHCLIVPIRHVTCTTQLDENEWSEILEFRKSLTNMFNSQNKSVVFYETAVNLHHYPHMVIHCIPMPEEQGDLAPIYFKKAIDECEMEWSTNKKLINMAGKDVRRSVPKGLPYFWVSFGMKEGFAHVVEEQKYFPKFFAEEIIGGILDLHHSKWRKSASQKFDLQKTRVMEFSKNWTKYDCTNK